MLTVRRESEKMSETDKRSVARVTLDDNQTFVKSYPKSAVYFDTDTIAPVKTTEAFDTTTTVRIGERAQGEDLMPTVHREEKAEAPVKKKAQLEQKSKTMLIVYVVLAVVLAVTVFAIGLAVSGVKGQNAQAQSRVDAYAATISAQEAQIMHLMSDDTIRGVATDPNGQLKMVEIGAVQSLNPIQPAANVDYPERTNFFDKICDFLSGIFG